MTMTATPATALIELPHSGLRVPDTTVRVTAYRDRQTPEGVAYTATLHHGDIIAGTIANHGVPGSTVLRLRDPARYGHGQFDAWAAQCRSFHGEQVTSVDVLDALVTEFDGAREIRRAKARGESLTRRMEYDHNGANAVGDPYPFEYLPARNVTDDPTSRGLLGLALERRPISIWGWWQLWTGERWEDITRPAVPVNRP